MCALHTTYEYDFTPTDSEADQMVSRKKALEKDFLAIEQTAVAKLKNLDWKDTPVVHTYESLYFRSYLPFVDGEKTLQDHIKYNEMVVTKVMVALTRYMIVMSCPARCSLVVSDSANGGDATGAGA